MTNQGSQLKGTLLVAGTTIGGGMLALPVLTSVTGFFPSLVIFIICWLFMVCTGLLFLEVCLWMKNETNIISMAKKTIGLKGEVASWILYLFLFYCLTIAYTVGCANLISEFFDGRITEWQSAFLFVFLFGSLVFSGLHLISKFNTWFMAALAIFYTVFVVLGYQYVDSSRLFNSNWSQSLFTLPIVFAAFAYQGIIPSLTSYLNYDVKKIRFCIIAGSCIPLITYFIWQWLIMGIVPIDGPYGLNEALIQGDNAVHPLKKHLNNPFIYAIGQYFAFFALSTSFLGVSVGLFDFLADGLKIRKTFKGKIILSSLIYIPALTISILYPHIFLDALQYAGGFGCALLLGLLPIMMVWSGRYRLGFISERLVPGGRILLTILILFVFIELCFEMANIFLK